MNQRHGQGITINLGVDAWTLQALLETHDPHHGVWDDVHAARTEPYAAPVPLALATSPEWRGPRVLAFR